MVVCCRHGQQTATCANVATGALCEVVGGAYPSSDASLQITELSTSRSPLCGWPATMVAGPPRAEPRLSDYRSAMWAASFRQGGPMSPIVMPAE